jgi:hypothetical protein
MGTDTKIAVDQPTRTGAAPKPSRGKVMLIDDVSVDPLSQTSALSSGYVGVVRV